MKVKAKMNGFYDNRRVKGGAEFVLKDAKHFDKYWMESLEKPKAEEKTGEKK